MVDEYSGGSRITSERGRAAGIPRAGVSGLDLCALPDKGRQARRGGTVPARCAATQPRAARRGGGGGRRTYRSRAAGVAWRNGICLRTLVLNAAVCAGAEQRDAYRGL